MDDKLTLFYNSLTANPAITGLPEDIGTFKTALSDPARSEVFYNSLKANPNIKGLPDNYKDFLSGLSIKAGGVTPQQPRQPFFEGLGRKGGVSLLSLGEMVTEIPQAVEAVANIPMNIFAGAMIKKAERKGEIDKETADFLREEQLYPKANFGQILPSVPGQESMGQALADSKLNEWFESNAEKLNETVTRYDQTATQYLKNKQFGNALGAISYGVAESIAPTLAAMLVPGGAAALGLGVGAQKYDEVKDREDMSEAMKLADSATSGIFEWLFEKFGSAEMAKYLKSYYNKVGGKGLQQAFGSQTMQNLIGKAYKKLGLWFAPVHEGVSEFATQIGQDLASKLSGESPDLTFQDIKANAIEAFLIGTGMGGFFSSTTALAKKVKDTVSPPSPLDTDTEPGAIGPLQVPRTQQEVEQIINEYGRNIKFGETPLEEDPDPMVSFAQTKLGQKVILKQEAGLSGDKFFIAIDTETKQPLFIKPADIVERKDVPYQQWFNDEMNNYLIVKDEADNVTAKIEAPVQEGQEVTLGDKTFNVTFVDENGITLNEIDEKGNLTEAELIVPPEDYEKVFGVPAVDSGQSPQENVTEQGQIIPGEAVQETGVEGAQVPQLPVNKAGEIEYEKITEPEMYAQGLQQEFGEDAPAIVDELINEQNEALKKAKKASSAIKRARKVKAINTELAKLTQVRDIISPQIEIKEEPGYDSENIQGLPGEVGGRQELEQAQPDEETGRGEIEAGGIFQEQGEEKTVQPIGEQPMAQTPSTPDETAPVEAEMQEAGEVEQPETPEAKEEQPGKHNPLSAFKPGDIVRNMTGDVWEVVDVPTDKDKKAILRDPQDGSTVEWNQKIVSWTLEKKEESKELISTAKKLSEFKQGDKVRDIYTDKVYTIKKLNTQNLSQIEDEFGNIENINTLNNIRYISAELAKSDQNVGQKSKEAQLIKANDQVDTHPTEAQKEAGNYPKGHFRWQGMDISIENAPMSIREGTDKSGKPWKQLMHNPYGYIRRTLGPKTEGKDQVDIFLGDNLESETVFVVDQVDPKTGFFDEPKVMGAFNSIDEARDAYLSNYEPGWKGLGAITAMPIEEFKQWVYDRTKTSKPVDAKVSLYDQEGNLADEISGMKASEILQNVNEGYWTEKEETPEEKPEFVGEYLKKHPGAFLKASDGSLDFGHIPAETGLKEAPIRLTEGNDSHGLLHIIEQHGEEIKKAGYKNVPSFVEDVAKNYTVIRAGTVYHDKPTFLLELVDKQNRTLIVELSRNGEYWNVNSAGIFRKGYSKNKKVVWSIPALGIKQSATTDDIAYPPENKSGTGKVSGNSPQTTSLEDKDTKKEETSQAPEQKKTEFAGEYLEKKPEEKVLKEEKPKGPDYKTPKGQAELLKYLIDAENNLASNQKKIASLKDSESLSPVKRKELKQRELLQEQNQKRINDLKEQIDNDILPPEKQNEIRKLIQETNTRNAVVANRILRLQDERDAKEKALQKRNTLLGDSKIEQEKQAGMQDLFAMEEVFQPKAENLQAALKPFNDAIKKSEEEIDRNNQLLDEKIDLVLKGTQGAIDWNTPPAEPDEKAEIPKEENPDELKLEIVEVSKPSQKIEDFGEHISGAKKEIRGQLKKHLETTDEDLLNNSISKVLPPVDYKNLVDSGMATPQEAAFLAYLRMGIGPKPKSPYKQRGWLQKVNAYKDALRWIIEKEEFMAAHEGQSMMELLEKSADVYLVKRMKDYINTLVELGFPNDVTSLKDYEIKHFESGVRVNSKGEKTDKPARWTIVKGHYIIQDFETRDQAIAGLKYILTTENEAPQKVKFDVWRERGKDGLFVGKKLGPGKFITLASGFDKLSEVRKYIENHQEELEKMLEQKKIIPYERPEERGPRIGKDYRKGENVTPELFSQTFGFRGVQFGNYVEQLKRQEDLNEAYDALMDLSEMLNIPSRAISLGGQLGIAFGARGSGGKKAPSAHYEPGEIVINLTKSAGAGSLAHEWFHAVDNYFSRTRGEKLGFLTERPIQLIDKSGTKSDLIRPEVIEAFKHLVNTIHSSGLRQRSKELDKRRTKDYWSQPIEMAARSFEAYIKTKLAESEIKNDYLVSFKDIVDYIVEAGGEEGVYPYPTKEESEKIFGAFDRMFQTIQTREEEGRVAMFRVAGSLESINQRFNDELDQQINNRLPKGHIYKLGMPGNALLSAGVRDIPIEMPAKVLETKSSKEYKSQHPFNLSEVINLPDAIQNPIAVFESERIDQPDRRVILTELKSSGKNFLAILDIYSRRGVNEVNSIVSIYPKDSAVHIGKWFDSETYFSRNLIRYVDKNKASQWLSGNSSYVNSAGLSSRRIANIINNFQNPAIPKEKKSAFRISRAGGKANNKPFQEFSDKDAIRAEKAAVKEFGTTEDWREVGYITFTGKKLDFSGKNDGGMPGERGYDHRQINSALDGIDLGKYETDKYWQDSASNGMYAFLDMGNIRVSSSFGGLAMTMMPTTEQFREIRNFIRLYNGMLSLDLNDTGVEYNKWTDEEQIINDIKRFYDEGIVPLPDFSAFRSNQPQGEALLESVIGGETPNYDRYLTNKITELGESFNTPITVVKNRYELPVRLQRQMQRDKVWNSRVTGLYDRQTGTIYVLLDDVKALGAERALDEVTKTVLHEIVAHKGLPKLLGEEAYNKLLDDLYWDIPQDDRTLLMYEYNTDDKRTISEEYLGMMAEDNINPNLFQRVLAKIRQLLRRLFRVSYSENDIRDMLRRSQENLRRPQTKDYEFAGEYLEDSVKEERSGSFRARQRVKQTLLEQAAEAYSEKEKKRQLSETMQGIREYFQDLNLPIRRFEEEVIKRGGQQDNQSKPYRDLNLSFGRHEKLYNDFFEEKMKPVLNAIAQLKKAGVPGENILPYIICKHAIERNAVMRGHELREWTDSNKNATFEDIEAQKEALKDKDYSGVMGFDKDGSYTNPDELARDIVKEFESQVQNKKLIDNLWSTTKAATNTILDAWEDGLQISPERKKEYQEQYRFYVPLRGWREGAAKDLVYTKGEGFSKSLRHAEGRKSLADNPLAYIQQVAFQAIAEQIDNEVKTSMSNLIIRNLKNNEIHELATIKKLYYVKVHLPDGTHEWEPTTDRPSPELFESGEATQKIYRAHERLRAPRQAKEHEVYVHRPGGDLVMIFKGKNLPVAQALNKQNYIYRNVFGHYDARDIDKAFMLMGHINNMLKSAYTSWNVVFPFTNFMRDFQEASITQAIKQGTGLKVIRNYKHAFPSIARHIAGRSDLKNPIDRELDDFYRLGGATGYTHLKTPEEIEKDINNEIKRMVREGTLRGDMQNSAITFLNAVEAWNRIFEDATRFAVYRASLAAGNTKEDAAIDAKEASVNFNRKGKGSKAWDSWFAFFNVALQSMQKNFSLAKHHPGRFSAVALSFITVGFIEAMMNALFDDDDDNSYYNINPYMRHNYLVIPNVISLIKGEGKGDKYLSIPLPQFWRGFKSMGAIGFDIASKRTRVIDGIMDALGNFGSSLLPVDIGGFWKSGEFSFAPIMPTVIKPIVEAAENKNYMGYAIMNEPFTRDQKKILANAGLGKKNVSPAAKFFTDMLFRWGGGDTKYKYYYDEAKGRHRKVPGVLDINPSAIEHLFKGYTGGTGAVFSDMITTISQAFDPDEEIDFRNTPFVNRFIRKTPEAKWNIIKEYYDLRDDSKVTNLLSKEYWKSGSYDKAMSILGDEYSMKYIQTIKHYESALDDAAKAMDYDTIEGSDLTIELMRQCIIDIRDLKEEHGKK